MKSHSVNHQSAPVRSRKHAHPSTTHMRRRKVHISATPASASSSISIPHHSSSSSSTLYESSSSSSPSRHTSAHRRLRRQRRPVTSNLTSRLFSTLSRIVSAPTHTTALTSSSSLSFAHQYTGNDSKSTRRFSSSSHHVENAAVLSPSLHSSSSSSSAVSLSPSHTSSLSKTGPDSTTTTAAAFRSSLAALFSSHNVSQSSSSSSHHQLTQHPHHSSTRQQHSTPTNSPSTSKTAASVSTPGSASPLGQLYAVGSVHHDFHVDSAETYPLLSLAVYTMTHQRSGAQFIHIERDDDDNAFCLGFRTLPQNDNGVAHILEHTVLCGSEAFPVRDPFFLLLRRSFATFMNAMTRPEATYYPFSTQNKQDFNNLLRVYLDAAFFPLLRKMDFRQEGHRIEPKGLFDEQQGEQNEAEEAKHTPLVDATTDNDVNTSKHHESTASTSSPDPSDPTTTPIPQEFEFKGVVFNEMKGDLSDPRSWLFTRAGHHLHTTSVYRNNSGGDPLAIPDLSYEDLLHFHATHYHPGNAVFMTYGSRPAVLEEANATIITKLEQLKKLYPEQCENSTYGQHDFPPHFTPEDAVTAVRDMTRFPKPRCVVEPGPIASFENSERPYKISMTWLCRDEPITDITSQSLLRDDIALDGLETTYDFVDIRDELVDEASAALIAGDIGKSVDETEQQQSSSHQLHQTNNEPVIKRRQVQTQDTTAWFQEQLVQEKLHGEALFHAKQEELRQTLGFDTQDCQNDNDEKNALLHDIIAEEHPDMLTLIPQPHKHLSQDLYNTIQRIKKLSPQEQKSLNLQLEQTALSILSSLLFDNVYSPLYAILSDPELGSSPSPMTGCDTWEHTPSISMGLNGVRPQDTNMVLKRLFTALETIAETGEGINVSTVGAILYQTEVSLKDPRKNYGVNMLTRLISPFAHGQDVQHGFQLIELLPLLQHIVETSGSIYFRSLIKHHMLSNTHRLTYIMTSDPTHNDTLQNEENKVLQEKIKHWDDQDKLQCLHDAQALKVYQDAPVDDSCLPTVSVRDINPFWPVYKFRSFFCGGQVTLPRQQQGQGQQEQFVNYFSAQHLKKQRKLAAATAATTENTSDVVANIASTQTATSTSPILSQTHPLTKTSQLSAPNVSAFLSSSSSSSQLECIPQSTPALARPISFNVQPTNGIVVLRSIIHDVGARLSARQLAYIPLLNMLFGRVGAGGRDYKSQGHLIDQTASDFSIQFAWDDLRHVPIDAVGQDEEDSNQSLSSLSSSSSSLPINDSFTSTFQASIKGKCLARNTERMCQLLTDSLTAGDFTEHVYNTLAQYAGGLQSALEENASRFAMYDAQARIPGLQSAVLHQEVYGLPHIQRITNEFRLISEEIALLKQMKERQQQQQGQGQQTQQQEQGSQDDNLETSVVGGGDEEEIYSPRLMKLANEIGETMRGLLLGMSAARFSPHDTTQQDHVHDSAQTDDVAQTQHQPPALKTHHPAQYADITATEAVYDNLVSNPRATVPATFPAGIDRVLVTCDEMTLNDPTFQNGIISGVSGLVNSVYCATPTMFNTQRIQHVEALLNKFKLEQETAAAAAVVAEAEEAAAATTTAVVTDESILAQLATSTESIAPSPPVVEQSTLPHDHSISANDWLAAASQRSQGTDTVSSSRFHYIASPVQVNSVVYAQPTKVDFRHPDFPVMFILAELVNETFLHAEIREKGGAYGRFASHSREGVFTMGSMRDPQSTRTVEVFQKAIHWLGTATAAAASDNNTVTTPPPAEGQEQQEQEHTSASSSTTATTTHALQMTEQMLNEAKISIFGGIDAPESPANRGLMAWLRNASDTQRQALRRGMLDVTLDDIVRVAQQHLNFQQGQVTIVGSQASISTSIQQNPLWRVTSLGVLDSGDVPSEEDGADEQDGTQNDE